MILRQLLVRGVNPNVYDRDGRQPVHWAAAAGAGDALLALVHHGDIDIDAADSRNSLTALHCAAAAGHTDCLAQLITLCGAYVDGGDRHSCTPLFYAAARGHVDAVAALLNLGAQPNVTDRKMRTAAHGAAERGHLAVLEELQRHGGELWAANAKGNLPLHEAVVGGHFTVVRWLLAQRPWAISAENGSGRQPLHLAAGRGGGKCSYNTDAMVRLLVEEYHAPINAICRGGRDRRQLYTPLDLATRDCGGSADIVRCLRQAGGQSARQLVSEVTLRQAFAAAEEEHLRKVAKELGTSYQSALLDRDVKHIKRAGLHF